MDDERDIVKQILQSYDVISSIREEDNHLLFSLKEKEYMFLYEDKSKLTVKPIIMVKNDKNFNYPHVLPFELPGDAEEKYRLLCLYENNDSISFMSTYEEKIIDIIERLIRLVYLSPKQVECEFHKEFLYYWNFMATNEYNVRVFLKNAKSCNRLNSYHDKNNHIRIVENGIQLNDLKLVRNNEKVWKFMPELPAFHIPIINNRGISPPTQGNIWTSKEIIMIVYGSDYNRISNESYLNLLNEKVKSKSVILLFSMLINEQTITFSCIVNLKNGTRDSLFNKLTCNIQSVQIVKSKRIDFYHLCNQIGNDTSIISKRVLLVGAGSLGSYVAKELIKTGIRNLTIYDSDKLEEENMLRHSVNGNLVDISKVVALKYELENLHPEIYINSICKNITDDMLREEMMGYDLIIFTVGNSDIQLSANRILKKDKYDKFVIYAWLEAGGEHSHILVVNPLETGCFECLYTDENGHTINNKANVVSNNFVEKSTIRNGCGATRVKYGNAVILRTTGVLLETIKKLFIKEIKQNTLVNITPVSVSSTIEYVERKCECCGNQSK